MTLRVWGPAPELLDDELNVLERQCAVVFGDDVADRIVVRVTEQYECDIDADDGPAWEAVVPLLEEAIKAEFRRVLTPH